jgi:hypothetical protein
MPKEIIEETKKALKKAGLEEEEPIISKEFLKKILGSQIKVFYFDMEEPERESPIWFEGKLTGFNEDIISVESETDFKKICLYSIESLYKKK